MRREDLRRRRSGALRSKAEYLLSVSFWWDVCVKPGAGINRTYRDAAPIYYWSMLRVDANAAHLTTC